MTLEQRLEQLEKHNKRLTTALTLTVVAMCAAATVAATGEKVDKFDTVTARTIFVENDAGYTIVFLGANIVGDGVVGTRTAEGKQLVMLNSEPGDIGSVYTYQPNGNKLVRLSASDNGGVINVYNKTGEAIADLKADEYGNGVVGAYNRKGKGRTLQPGP